MPTRPFRLSVAVLWPLLIAGSTVWLTSPNLSAQTFTFQQNDNGQRVTNADGSVFTYPSNDQWTQPYATSGDLQGNTYTSAVTNWNTLTTYPNSAGANVVIGASTPVTLNDSVSFQNLTLGTGAGLTIVSGNSGGAGNHAITVNAATGGVGLIQNDGTLTVSGTDQDCHLVVANPLTLTGAGTLVIQNTSRFDDTHVDGPGTITQTAGHTIKSTGGGYLGAPFINAGTIGATSGTFLLDGGTGTNTGELYASSGGTLQLQQLALNNAGGTITIDDPNSYVDLSYTVTVTGGTLAGASAAIVDGQGGYFYDDGSMTLANVTFAAGSAFRMDSPIVLVGMLTNNGLFQGGGFNFNTGQTSGFILGSDAAITGTGVFTMNSSQVVAASGTATLPTLTQGAGHTTKGHGTISISFNNAGLVDASDGNNTLGFIGSASAQLAVTNAALMRASNGGTLQLQNVNLNNTGGTLSASDTTSNVDLSYGTTVTGGTLQSANGASGSSSGLFYDDGDTTLNNVTLAAGSYFRGDNNIFVVGTLTNNGDIDILHANFNTGEFPPALTASADATIAGTGVVNLQGGAVTAKNNATFTLAGGSEIQGSGTVSASLVNNGTVAGTYQGFTINGPTFTNNALLSANNNANVAIDGGTSFTNFHAGSSTLTGGTYQAQDLGNGATLDFGGRNVLVNAATVVLDGANANFGAVNGLTTNEGTFTLRNLKQFTDGASALTNAGTVNLDAGTTLHVNGTFTGSDTSTLAVTLGGTATSGATSPGILQADGAATVGGTLTLAFPATATLPANTDTLTVLSATSPVTGSFGNAASGARLNTADGKGSFRVSYGTGSASPNAVVLSDFLPPGQADSSPTVTLTAAIPTVTAGDGQIGEFLLTLSSAPTSDVVVNLTIKGTAVNGTDYVLLKTTKKIKAGHTSKPIKITPVGAGAGPGVKQVVALLLAPGNGYTVGTTSKVKVKIFGQ